VTEPPLFWPFFSRKMQISKKPSSQGKNWKPKNRRTLASKRFALVAHRDEEPAAAEAGVGVQEPQGQRDHLQAYRPRTAQARPVRCREHCERSPGVYRQGNVCSAQTQPEASCSLRLPLEARDSRPTSRTCRTRWTRRRARSSRRRAARRPPHLRP
jgi:hypothetical protein